MIGSPQSTCVVHDCWCKGAAVEKFGNYLAINKQCRPSLSQLEGTCLLQRHPLSHQPHLIHLIEQHATLVLVVPVVVFANLDAKQTIFGCKPALILILSSMVVGRQYTI